MKKYFFIMLANIALSGCMEQAIHTIDQKKFEELCRTVTNNRKSDLLELIDSKILVLTSELQYNQEPDPKALKRAALQTWKGFLFFGIGMVGATWGLVVASQGNTESAIWTGSLLCGLGLGSMVQGVKDMKDSRNILKAYNPRERLEESLKQLRYMREYLMTKATAATASSSQIF